MKVDCDAEETYLDGDYGEVLGIQVTCDRCGHYTESFGTAEGSVRRCLALMREECPRGEANFYLSN